MQSQFFVYLLVTLVVTGDLATAADSRPNQGMLVLNKAEKLMAQGDRYRAAPLYLEAETLFRSENDPKGEVTARLGRLHASTDRGDYSAIKSLAQKELDTPIVRDDAQLKIKVLALMGLADLNTDTAAAQQDFADLLSVATSSHNPKWENRARGELAIIAGINGRLAEAGSGILKAIATAKKLGDSEGAFHFTLWLANGLAVNGMADGALKQLAFADDLAKASGFDEAPLSLTIAHLRAIANLNEQERSGHLAEADKLYSAALRLAEKDSVPGAEIELLEQHGKLALASGNPVDAERSLRQAVKVAQSSGLARLEVESAMTLAELLLSANQPARAEQVLKDSTMAAHAMPDRWELPRFIGLQAAAAAALRQKRKADKLYQRARVDLEGLLVDAPSSQVKASMLSVYGHLYVGQFRLALEQFHDLAKAFKIIESARGRVLLDSLRYSREREQLRSAQREDGQVAALQRQLLQDHLTNSQARLVLAKLDAAYDELSAAIFEQNRNEVQVLRGSPVALSSFSRSLASDSVFVEYILDRDASYAFEISGSGGTNVHRLPPKAEIESMVRRYLADIKAEKKMSKTGEMLFNILLKPVSRPSSKLLILAPDGALHLLPFQSLRDENGKFVLEQTSISFAPSATVLSAIRQLPPSSSRGFLGLAYSSTNKSDADSKRSLAELRGADLKPLQFASEEVHQASAALGNSGELLEGSQASEFELKRQNLSRFRVIHLAAHAFGDQLQPDRAGIVLYPGSSTEDGLWQAREIRATKLQADVVVLSACQTGTGRLEGEEGIMNLARVFLAAGAKSVLASQWDIDDRSTATLMESFYQQLSSGNTVQEALRQAQLAFIKDYGTKAGPYFWAGFSVYGDGRRIIAATSDRANAQTARTSLR